MSPIIELRDRTVIYASLRGWSEDRRQGIEQAQATHLSILPWAAYGAERELGTNNFLFLLPKETPRLEKPFEIGKLKSGLIVFQIKEDGRRSASWIHAGKPTKFAGKTIAPLTYEIEKKEERVVEEISPAPSWLIEARKDAKMRATVQRLESIERKR